MGTEPGTMFRRKQSLLDKTIRMCKGPEARGSMLGFWSRERVSRRPEEEGYLE